MVPRDNVSYIIRRIKKERNNTYIYTNVHVRVNRASIHVFEAFVTEAFQSIL